MLAEMYFYRYKQDEFKEEKGVGRYRQPIRSAYKINDGQYGCVLINISRLVNDIKQSSGRPNLTRGTIYYTTPEDFMNRLTALTSARCADKNNLPLRIEVWQILDELLKLSETVSKVEYDAYVKRKLIKTNNL